DSRDPRRLRPIAKGERERSRSATDIEDGAAFAHFGEVDEERRKAPAPAPHELFVRVGAAEHCADRVADRRPRVILRVRGGGLRNEAWRTMLFDVRTGVTVRSTPACASASSDSPPR